MSVCGEPTTTPLAPVYALPDSCSKEPTKGLRRRLSKILPPMARTEAGLGVTAWG